MNLKKKLSLVLAMATATVAVTSAYAWFTDRVDANASAKAGTLELKLVDTEDIEDSISVTAPEKLYPGVAVKLDYTLSNEGNKSADVREVFVLTSEIAMTEGEGKQEYALYAADQFASYDEATGYYTLINGAQEVEGRVFDDDKKITYEVTEFILNGKGTGAETEENIDTNEKDGSYYLVIKNSMGNAFVGKKVTVEYEAQAKQHRNTNDATWSVVKSEEVTFGGNDKHPAVPEVQ